MIVDNGFALVDSLKFSGESEEQQVMTAVFAERAASVYRLKRLWLSEAVTFVCLIVSKHVMTSLSPCADTNGSDNRRFETRERTPVQYHEKVLLPSANHANAHSRPHRGRFRRVIILLLIID